MKKILLLVSIAFVLLAVLACDREKPKPLSVPGEKLYAMRGTIVSRSANDNMLTIAHEAIPGFMEAMTMEYPVRGATLDSLPPDHARIEATLHVTDSSYWLTNVHAAK